MGDDAEYFTLTDGVLTFSSPPDYEMPRGMAMSDANTNSYMVTVKAEAGGEMAMQAVTINVTNEDELDGMLTADMESPISYMENGTMTVATYTASGPMAATATWTKMGDDAEYFTLTDGVLTFSSPPDYEMPRGMAMSDANTNSYMVTVKAEAGGEMAMQAVTINVTNEDELDGMLTADMESPISYMENGTMTVATYTASGPMAATATWTKMGDDAEYFTLTDGVLTFSSPPDYEMPRGMAMSDANTNSYMVTVKAEAGGEMAMQAVTINVTNEDELDGMLTADMESPISYMENGTMTVATYTASGPMAATATWTKMGDDAEYFTLTDGVLTFSSPPDYEMPRGMAMSDANTNSYMVTVKAEAGGEMAMQAVNVMVTNVDELGTLSGPGSPISYMENGTMTVATYTGSGTMADTASWTLEGDDAEYFTLTGGVLTFKMAPDYEMPRGQAMSDTNTNTYMVTVKASASGEMEMLEVTVEVTDVDELGTLSGPGSPISYMENGTMTVATYTVSGTMADTASWTLEGDDAEYFTLTGGVLTFKMAPDYEMPRGQAMSDTNTNTYMVTVKASAGGEMEMLEVTVTVTDVDENVAPAFPSATATRSIAENTAANTNIGDPVAATDPNGDTLTYSLEGTDAASFGIDGSTGQLSTSAALDFETKTPYTVVVKATDPDGLSDTIDVTINVTDVDDGAVTPVDLVGRYDTNGTEGIQIDELFDAIDDYFAGGIITIDQLFQIIDAYFLG